MSIGQRRKPALAGKPGYLRIDSVHQGDLDGKKGVYHINAVDEVTQFQAVVCVEKISEAYLLAALEELFAAFPFAILGFHSATAPCVALPRASMPSQVTFTSHQ